MSRLFPRFHPLAGSIRPRPYRRLHILGSRGTLWEAHTLSLRTSYDLHIRAAYQHTSMHTTPPPLRHRPLSGSRHTLRSRECAPHSTQLVYHSINFRIHTSLRRNTWPYLLCPRLRDAIHTLEEQDDRSGAQLLQYPGYCHEYHHTAHALSYCLGLGS